MSIETAVLFMLLGNPDLADELEITADDFHELADVFTAVMERKATNVLRKWLLKLGVDPESEGVRAAMVKKLRRHTDYERDREVFNRRKWEIAVFGESALEKRDEQIAELKRELESKSE